MASGSDGALVSRAGGQSARQTPLVMASKTSVKRPSRRELVTGWLVAGPEQGTCMRSKIWRSREGERT